MTKHDTTPFDGCPECLSPDPQLRAAHQLSLAQSGGLTGVRGHLTEQYVTRREGHKRRPDLVDDVCHWIANLIEQFSHMPDPATGQPLPWWAARQQMAAAKDRMAAAAYGDAPERYRASAEGWEVEGFARVRLPVVPAPATPFPPEPAVDIPRLVEVDEAILALEYEESEVD